MRLATCQRPGRAFTLLELLVASALSAILAMLAVQLTTSLLNGWNRAFEQASLRQQAELSMDLLVRDLEGCRPGKKGTALSYQSERVDECDAFRLTFPIVDGGVVSLCSYWLETPPTTTSPGRPLWRRAVATGPETFAFLRDHDGWEIPPDSLFPESTQGVVTDGLVRARVRFYFLESSSWREIEGAALIFPSGAMPHLMVLECSFLSEKGWRQWQAAPGHNIHPSLDEILASEGLTLTREVRIPAL